MISLVGSLLLGWVVGGLGNWVADHLPYFGTIALTGPWHNPRQYWLGYWPNAPLPQRTSAQTPSASHRWRTPLLLFSMAGCFAWTTAHLLPSGSSIWQADYMAQVILAWFYIAFFLVVLVIDLEHRRVLNIMLWPVALVALLSSLLPGTPTLLNALLGGGVGFGLFLLIFVVGRGRMGAGDVKLAGLIGLIVGYPTVWTALVLGILIGGLAALLLLASRRATLRSSMAYAPYLAFGAIIAIWQSWGAAGGL